MSELILAVGAAGKFAGYVVPALVARGATVRGLAHEAKVLASIRGEGAADALVVDLTDRRSIAVTLDGVESVFYVAPAFLANATGRRPLVMAAVTTSGSPFDIGEDTARRRMERAGVWLTSTNTMFTELVGDWSTPAAEQMMPVLFASAPIFAVD
jgi:hypothetical protein